MLRLKKTEGYPQAVGIGNSPLLDLWFARNKTKSQNLFYLMKRQLNNDNDI
jgi:hypothetical protein